MPQANIPGSEPAKKLSSVIPKQVQVPEHVPEEKHQSNSDSLFLLSQQDLDEGWEIYIAPKKPQSVKEFEDDTELIKNDRRDRWATQDNTRKSRRHRRYHQYLDLPLPRHNTVIPSDIKFKPMGLKSLSIKIRRVEVKEEIKEEVQEEVQEEVEEEKVEEEKVKTWEKLQECTKVGNIDYNKQFPLLGVSKSKSKIKMYKIFNQSLHFMLEKF